MRELTINEANNQEPSFTLSIAPTKQEVESLKDLLTKIYHNWLGCKFDRGV